MRKTIATALLAAVVPVCVFAQTVADCAKTEDDLDRLACYDLASGRTAKTVAQSKVSQWSLRSEKSDFKDTTDVYLSTDSADAVACGFQGSQPITLFLRCTENTTALILTTHCHVASGFYGYGKVEYRLDNQKAQKRNFDASTDNSSLGLWNGRAAISLIKSMLSAETLLVRFTPFNENPVSARFNISGLEQAIEPLRKSCKW